MFGTTDDARDRPSPSQQADRLFDAQEAGAIEQQMRDFAAESFVEVAE